MAGAGPPRVSVDAALCQGHARCIALVPEVFVYDDDSDQSRPQVDLDGPVVPIDRLLAAAKACPEQAITVEREGMSSETLPRGLPPQTVEFDHHTTALAADPYPVYDELRMRCPVTWTAAYEGFWVLTDYATVYAAARDGKTYRSGQGTLIPPSLFPVFPIDTDAPQTQQLRRMIHDRLSPPAILKLEPHIYETANSLVDAFIGRGECDLVQDFSHPLPVRTVMPALGVAEAGWRDFAIKVVTVSNKMNADPAAAMEAGISLCNDFMTVIEDRRTNGLRDDIISALLMGELDGEPLSDGDLIAYLLTLVGGGIFTTTAAMANAMIRIHRRPELWQQLLARPDLVPNAVEEFLRVDAPIQMVSRTLARDVELHGCPMKTGERTMLVWAVANHDPEVFDNPDEVRFDRETNHHLTFGMGLHRCIGSNLGRAMFRIMLETVLARMPDLELVGDPEEHRFEDPGMVYGLSHLMARFTPDLPRGA